MHLLWNSEGYLRFILSNWSHTGHLLWADKQLICINQLWLVKNQCQYLDTYLIVLIYLMQLTHSLYQQFFHIFWHIPASDCRSASGVFPDAFSVVGPSSGHYHHPHPPKTSVAAHFQWLGLPFASTTLKTSTTACFRVLDYPLATTTTHTHRKWAWLLIFDGWAFLLPPPPRKRARVLVFGCWTILWP